jgi:gamma-glutamylputrescine oxidase
MSRPEAAAVRDAVAWFDRKEPPLAPLNRVVHTDAVVVGGGMMGLMCARMLVARGRSVCLVEADTCGGAASGRSSGFITPDSELELTDLVRQFGRDDARRLWDFGRGGVTSIRDAIRDHRIDCDFQTMDSLIVAAKARAAKWIREEHATRESLGYASTLRDADSLPTVLGAKNFHGAIRFGDTFGLDAYRCCAGLRRALLNVGAQIYEQSPVTRIHREGIETASGRIHANQVVVCTDRFLPQLGLAAREVYHAQTFLALSEPLAHADIGRMFPAGPLMVWDTDLIYRYFRLTGDGRLLIGGSTLLATYARHEQHRPADVARRLTRYLRTHFPEVNVAFTAAWPGLIGISKDFAPVVGRHPEHANVHFAGGAAGLPWAAALGRYLAEKVLDGRDDLDGLLSVERHFPIGRSVQAMVGAPAAFAVAHGIKKFVR